jgi:GAF domain-containing protein
MGRGARLTTYYYGIGGFALPLRLIRRTVPTMVQTLLQNRPQIDAILHAVCNETNMGFAAVARVTENRWMAWQSLDRIEFGLNPGDELDIKMTLCDDIRRSGKAIIIDDVRSDPTWRTHPVPALYGFQSYASLPITLENGQFFGTLCAIDPNARNLSGRNVVGILEHYAAEVGRLLSLEPADL